MMCCSVWCVGLPAGGSCSSTHVHTHKPSHLRALLLTAPHMPEGRRQQSRARRRLGLPCHAVPCHASGYLPCTTTGGGAGGMLTAEAVAKTHKHIHGTMLTQRPQAAARQRGFP
jgi:hypothetical protein